jgi:signal transduction histidine kinase
VSNAASATQPPADVAQAAIDQGLEAQTLAEKRRRLLLVRTGLTLAIGYMLIFSTPAAAPPGLVAFVVAYIASNIVIALLPARILGRAGFDVGLILADTAAISFSLLLIPEADTDVFIFYFTIILLASISDRMMLSLLAPLVTSGAYLAFLLTRHTVDEVMQPAVLLRLPFFLLTGTFYGFFVDRIRRGQLAMAASRQRSQARTELLSLITHDLKQPLWVATQSAAMLYDQLGREPAATRDLAAQVMVSLRRMEALTLNFLDLSKLESRGLRATPRRVSFARLVDDLFDTYRAAIELKGLHADIAVAANLPAAWIDPLQLERCLANLLDNAIKFTPAGGTVSLRATAEDGALSVLVGDSGPGIPPEREATMFARFQDGADTGDRRSTGLGLHIARALLEAMGGEIRLDRTQGSGAWFRIRLPLAADAAAPPALPAAAHAA